MAFAQFLAKYRTKIVVAKYHTQIGSYLFYEFSSLVNVHIIKLYLNISHLMILTMKITRKQFRFGIVFLKNC